MRPQELVGEARTPEGRALTLLHRAGHFAVCLDGRTLMSSAAHHSEEQMAELACADLAARPGARVLVGGLGMGFTLRAVLDRLAPDARVRVVELLATVVEWNRGPLAHLAEHPLDDPRVEVVIGDVASTAADRLQPFDAVLLDVDNGPEAFSERRNARLYEPAGLTRLREMLRPSGVLVIWSAFESPRFLRTLERAGLEARAIPARARGQRGRRHTLFLGRRSSA